MNRKKEFLCLPFFKYFKFIFCMELKPVLILLACMAIADIVFVNLGIAIDSYIFSLTAFTYAVFSSAKYSLQPSENSIFSFTKWSIFFASVSVPLLIITGLMVVHLLIWSFYGLISGLMVIEALLHYPIIYLIYFCTFLVLSIFTNKISAFDPVHVITSIFLGSVELEKYRLFPGPETKYFSLSGSYTSRFYCTVLSL